MLEDSTRLPLSGYDGVLQGPYMTHTKEVCSSESFPLQQLLSFTLHRKARSSDLQPSQICQPTKGPLQE